VDKGGVSLVNMWALDICSQLQFVYEEKKFDECWSPIVPSLSVVLKNTFGHGSSDVVLLALPPFYKISFRFSLITYCTNEHTYK